MFRNAIVDTPFTGSLPDSMFHRITGSDFRGDYSLISTLRALVFPRMQQEDTIRFRYKEISFSKGEIERNHHDVILRCAVSVAKGVPFSGNSIYLFNTVGYDDANVAIMDIAEKHFVTYSGNKFTKVEKLTEYYRKFFRIYCFVNPEIKTTVIFTDGIDLRRFHFLQIALPVMLPWYFPAEAGVSDQEKAIMESLRERTPDSYLAALAAAAEKYDFRSMKIKNELGSFENRFLEQEEESVRREIDRYMSQVQDYEENIAALMRRHYDANIRLLGIQTKLAQGDGTSEIVNYFIRNRNLSLVSVDNSQLTFDCKGYLTYFDEEGVRRYINNKRSVMYSISDRIPDSDIALLMKALFLDQRLRMKFCARYVFDLRGSVMACSGVDYGSEFNDCTPNPHIDRFSCLGNQERAINERLREHDYIGAIEQCISSCVSLNFADGTVIGEFMRRIYGASNRRVNIRCIELPDGRTVAPVEAIQWLKEQDEQKETQEATVAAVEGTNE